MAPVGDVAGAGESGAAAGRIGDEGPVTSPGVLELYRSMVAGARTTLDAARRRRIAIAVEISVVVLYVLLRTADAGRPVLILWSLLAMAIAVVSPVSGLVILAAIAPFSEPFSVTRQLGVKPFLVVALGVGAAIRAAPVLVSALQARRSAAGTAASRPWRALLPTVAIASAVLLLVITGLGVIHTRLAFGADLGDQAAQAWLAGMGGGMVVFLAAVLAGRAGAVRAITVAVASSLVGAALSLADFLEPGSVRGAALGWLLRPDRFAARLTGIIPSPNGVAALLIVPTGVLVAMAVLGRDARLRLVAGAGALLMGVSLYFTYSRAALIGLFLVAVVVVWRIRRKLGMALLVVGLVGGIALLPTYLRSRNAAVGGEGNVRPGDLLVASDAFRLRAWGSAAAMLRDAPLTGQGFLSYQWLHERYGDPILRAPHNEWLRLFAEEGVIGGLVGLVFLASAAGAVAVRRGPLAAGALGGFLGLAVAATFNNPFLYVQVMAIGCTVAGVAVGLGYAARRDVAEPVAAAATSSGQDA